MTVLTASQFLTEKILEYDVLAGIGLEVRSLGIVDPTKETARSIRSKILSGKDTSWESPAGYVFPISLGRGVTISSVLARWSEIENSIGSMIPNVQASFTRYPLQIEITKPKMEPMMLDPKILTGWNPYQTIVGIDLSGNRYVGIDLEETAHTLVAGTTGSGKTSLIETILAGLTWKLSPDQLELYLIDLKNSGVSDWGDLPHVRACATEGGDAAEIIKHVRSELQDRNQRKEKNAPWILLVCDEVAELARCGIDDLFEVSFTSIAQLGRERHVGILAGTQKPDTTVMPSQMLQQFNTVFLGRVKSSRQGTDSLGVGETGAQYLPIKSGAFLMMKPGLQNPIRLTAFLTPPEARETILRKWGAFPQRLIDLQMSVEQSSLTTKTRLGETFNVQEDGEKIRRVVQEYVSYDAEGLRVVRRGGFTRMSEALGTSYGGSTIDRINRALEYLRKNP